MPAELTKLQNGSDIRGVALEGVPGQAVNLTPTIAGRLACAFAHWLSRRMGSPLEELVVAVGRDSRLSGPDLMQGVVQGLLGCGLTVQDCGMASTPAMFMATQLPGHMAHGSIMITASHLPFNRNGMKFFTPEGGVEKADITEIIALAEQLPQEGGQAAGKLLPSSLIKDYAAHLCQHIRAGIRDTANPEKPLTGLKIALDAGNGAGGFYASQVLQALGADTSASQFLEPDGHFPNHVPNPEDEAAMAAISKATREGGCHMGIIFDTDVDRAAAVDSTGQEINRNRLIALISAIVLEENPGGTIVTDSVTSDQLTQFITARGGVHHRFKRGYKNVINEAIRLEGQGICAPLAIETSGHAALKENYFLDDGAYLVSKLLVRLALLHKQGKGLDALLEGFGEPAESCEARLRIAGEDFAPYGQQVLDGLLAHAKSQGWQIAEPNYEGVRISFGKEQGDGWALLRLSLHDPLLPLNIESNTVGGVTHIARQLEHFLAGYARLDITPLQAVV